MAYKQNCYSNWILLIDKLFINITIIVHEQKAISSDEAAKYELVNLSGLHNVDVLFIATVGQPNLLTYFSVRCLSCCQSLPFEEIGLGWWRVLELSSVPTTNKGLG